MKLITRICFWLLLLAGCSKDELAPGSDQLVGTWRLDEEGTLQVLAIT